MGGQDKQGFPMKQGVLVPGRVRLLMKPGDSCFRGYGRRTGERRRKSVRGCIVSPDLSVLNLMIVKQGECLNQTSEACAPATCAVAFEMAQSCAGTSQTVQHLIRAVSYSSQATRWGHRSATARMMRCVNSAARLTFCSCLTLAAMQDLLADQ